MPQRVTKRPRTPRITSAGGFINRGSTDYATADELYFLAGLGTWKEGLRTPRRQLLERYLTSIPRRSDWGSIDAVRVAQAVRQALEEYDAA